jgi:hypothetical protein
MLYSIVASFESFVRVREREFVSRMRAFPVRGDVADNHPLHECAKARPDAVVALVS